MRAVADAGPLRYLVLTGAIAILPGLFQRVFAPEAVRAELSHARTPDAVRAWMTRPPPWLTVSPAPANEDAALSALDAGERAVLALSASMRPDFILMDDREGVAMARLRGFAVLGTLGLLDRAARQDLISLGTAITALKATNFHAREDLFEVLLARDRARRGGS